MYNVIFRPVNAIIVPVGMQYCYIFIVCVCRLRYPTPEAHVPHYIVMWPVSFYHIFSLYLKNGEVFGIKVIKHKRILIFSTNLSETLFFIT